MLSVPPPSQEQAESIDVWNKGHNQVCSAAAGSGKTTMLLHACASSSVPVCICTYNKQLEVDMSSKLKELGMEHHHCYTFHGLCSRYFQNTPDDDTMHEVLGRVQEGDVKLKRPFNFARICIDEAQDMKMVFWQLLTCLVADFSGVQWFLVGDEIQMLNDYDEDDPALLDFMRTPAVYFGDAPWRSTRLSTSFRLHGNLAYIVNSMLNGGNQLVPGNRSPELAKHPVWLCTESNWNWSRIIVPWLINCRDDPSIDRIFILVAKKKGNPPLKVLINKLSRSCPVCPGGFPIYIHGVDNQDSRVQAQKIVVTTWHASKGMQCDAAAVVGVDWDSKHNPLHVALSRSKGHLLVIQDKQKPNPVLSSAARCASHDVIRIDKSTREMDLENISIPVDSDECNKEFIVNLDGWSQRGRCLKLQALILDVCSTKRADADVLGGVQQIGDGGWADVSRYYERAAKLKFEFEVTGGSKFLDFMKSPQRMTKEVFGEKLRRFEQGYALIGKASREDILPEFAWDMLRRALSKQQKNNRDWMTIAVCAECWNGFHHNIRQLLPCEWARADVLERYVRMLHEHLSDCQEIDSRLIKEEGDTLFTCRCFAHCSHSTYVVMCEDEISRSSRIRAVFPLCLHSTADRCVILNLKTGETRTLSVTDKAEFLSQVPV